MKALVVVVLLLLGLLFVADRAAVGFAEDRVAAQIERQGALQGRPDVDIAGFPFLTQALGGRYDEVRIGLTSAQLGQPEGIRADLVLRGVDIPLSAAVSGSVRDVPVERIDGAATVPYGVLSAGLGGDTSLAAEGDRLRVTRTVDVLGRQLPLTATGTVALEGSDIVVDVAEASGAGIDVPDWLLSRAAGLLDLRHPVPALPFGLRLTGVRPAQDGVDLTVEARDTVLSSAGE